METICDDILMSYVKWTQFDDVIIDILEVLLRRNSKTTNWPNHATSDNQDAKNQNYPIFFIKIVPSQARMCQN